MSVIGDRISVTTHAATSKPPAPHAEILAPISTSPPTRWRRWASRRWRRIRLVLAVDVSQGAVGAFELPMLLHELSERRLHVRRSGDRIRRRLEHP